MTFSRFKDRFLGNPEQSLQEAYEAASRIKAIEDGYFNGGRIPIESAANNAYFSPALREDVEKNLNILQRKTKEFNSSSSAAGNLGPNHLEKLIFVEGVLAKYTVEQSGSSALAPNPMAGTVPSQSAGQPNSSALNVIDVPSAPTQSGFLSRSSGKTVNKRQKQTYTQTDDKSFVSKKKTVLPRSIGRTINKIKEELDPKAEERALNELRSSKAKTIISLRTLALLIIIPILTQQISKNFLILPIVEQFRAGDETQVFLNSEMREEALEELHSFEEELKLESMIHKAPPISPEVMEEKVQDKANELAEEFRRKSNSSISNVFADLMGIVGFALVILFRREDINVLKSFIDKIIYGLSDSAKAFVIILLTDIFVGFHSPHGWEVLLEGMANHLGVAANHSAISLFIATVPVVMDTMLKYWLFRYLSQMSPSTLATVKDMNE